MRSAAFKIAAIYTVVALVWIALSDKLLGLARITTDPEQLMYLNIIKGWVYVLFTGFMLYKLIHSYNRRLAASEKQYRSYFENNPSPMWIYKRDTLQFTDVNDAAISQYGYSRDEFKRMRITDIRPSGYADAIKKILKTLPEGANDVGTWVHRKKNGELIDVQISLQHIKNDDGNKIMALAKDVTEVYRLEEEKKDYLLRLEDMLNSISDAFYTIDKQWNIGMANTMFEKISGYKREDIIGHNFFELWPKARESAFYRNFNKALTDRVTVKFDEYSPVLNKWLRMACYPTKEGLAIYFTDITEIKEKDMRLRQALDRYNQAAAATQDMLYEFDLVNNKVSYSQSRGHFAAFDISNEPDPSAAWLSNVHPEDRQTLTKSFENSLSLRSATYSCEYRLNCGYEKYRWVSDQASIIYNDDGQPLRIVGAVRDINDLKDKEESLRQQNIILRDIAWIESHEIRRPLASILGLVEVANNCETETDRRAALRFLKASATELDEMIRKITGKIEEVAAE